MGFVFDEHDAYRILRDSEDQPDFNGKKVGHAIARHVNISKRKLNDRMYLEDATMEDLAIYTAFMSVRDQAKAVAAAFNSSDPRAEKLMNRFFHPDHADTRPGKPLKLEKVEVPVSSVRVAANSDRTLTMGSSYVTVYFSKFPGRHRNMHIVTAFATFLGQSHGNIVTLS
jgi:hypothetical protein